MAHDGESQISDGDCLIQLDIFRSGAAAAAEFQQTSPIGFDINSDSLKKQVARVSPSVVLVVAESRGTGSGFVVAGRNLIVTNRHVILGARAISVLWSDGRGGPAAVRAVGQDGLDLAVLAAQVPADAGVPLGDSDRVGPGEFVFVMGTPDDLQNSVSFGVIAGVRGTHDGVRLQFDAALSPGNSGGPIFNMSGEVIGVATSSRVILKRIKDNAGDSHTIDRAQNLNFAIPSNEVDAFLAALSDDQALSFDGSCACGYWRDSGPCPVCGRRFDDLLSHAIDIIGRIGPAKCQCEAGWDAMWFIKRSGMKCSTCGRERHLSVPPRGLMTMPCQCEAGARATWFITRNGNYTCSNCGRER